MSHDAAIAVVEDDDILFAAHAERYSRVKNDHRLNEAIVAQAMAFGAPDLIAWYERPFLKKTRQAYAGQWREVFSTDTLPRNHLRRFGLDRCPIVFVNHHEAHAAAGYFTSGFPDAVVIVADAIGEWSCFSVGEYDRGRLAWHKESRYPHSLGLLYSAFTHRCGLKPNEHEYIVMGMAAFGEPRHVDQIYADLVVKPGADFNFALRQNPHRGIGAWMPEARIEDIAASIQAVTEEILLDAVRWAAANLNSKHLLLTGGVALNCVANARIADLWFEHTGRRDGIWIMPNPGDAGSSLGAVAAHLQRRLNWRGPYLGTGIDRAVDMDALVDALAGGEVVALANGRAEFGPRALGNRSILADPRGQHMKDKVNSLKRREKFRPFAPIVLEEHAADYFDMVVDRSPYMQYTMRCKAADELPGIVHADGSSRVQTVTGEQNELITELLTRFHQRTGCPILLNTSMNIKGEPLVDTWTDAERFREANGVRVF